MTTKLFSGHGLGKNKGLVKIYQKMAKKMLPDFILYDDQKLFLESEDAIGLAINEYSEDPYAMSLFKNELNLGDIVVDAGANIGLYTLPAAKIVSNSGKVYSFEPDSVSFSNLKKNVVGNGIENTDVVNKALSSKTGKAKFASSEYFTRMRNVLINDQEKSKSFVTVDTISLDDFFKDKPKKVNFIKIDIEGAEFEALKGMKNILAQNVEIKILLEFHPQFLTSFGTNISEFLDFLFSFKYFIYNIDEKKKKMYPVNKKWLMNYADNHPAGGKTNLICLRESR